MINNDLFMPIDSQEKTVNIRVLPTEFWIYSYPMLLAFHGKSGKRVEAGKWSLEIKKMLNGIIKSVLMLENLMNNSQNNERIFIGKREIVLDKDEAYWMLIYFIDNSILRIYACLDKTSQMCRSYFEHSENGNNLKFFSKCGCQIEMDDKNCSFGNLINSLENDSLERNIIIKNALKNLNKNPSICKLREYRNMFTHRIHELDQTMDINPDLKIDYLEKNEIINFSFGKDLPSINWFRVEIVNSHNAIIDCLAEIWKEIFPADFNIKKVDNDNKIS